MWLCRYLRGRNSNAKVSSIVHKRLSFRYHDCKVYPIRVEHPTNTPIISPFLLLSNDGFKFESNLKSSSNLFDTSLV